MISKHRSFFRRHKFLAVLFALLGGVCLVLLCVLFALRRGPYHRYELDLLLTGPADAEPGLIEVGVAKRDITPDFDAYDAWTDVDGDNEYDADVDTFEDRNGNGRFDGIWLAGFGNTRPAKGVHDAPWVRALALRNNGVTVVLVTIDSIGIFHNNYITIRKSIDPGLGIDHVLFSATHSHEVPDTMKIWSGPIPIWGYQPQYMERIQQFTKEAIEEAAAALAPAELYCAQVEIAPPGFVRDSRKPEVIDPRMSLLRFARPGTDETIATFVNWGNHPETLGSDNPLITSDFPHYLREGVEQGVPDPRGVAGLGGMCLYFQGQVGGLMTQLRMAVPHRDGETMYAEAGFEKAQALGENLAIAACKALRGEAAWKCEAPRLALAAETIKIKVSGQFKLPMMLGLIHEGYYWGGRVKTELNVLRVGDALMLSVPCEIYPEIVEGGIVALEGRDYPIDPIEVPPLRVTMEAKARMALVIGLANDEIGYVIPKSQWDAKAPFVYDGKDQYGEENSGGPDVGPAIHRASLALLERMNAVW